MPPEVYVSPAKVDQARPISKVWLVPFVALTIGLWMLYFNWSNQGPLITISFDNAEGLEIDITKIKLRDITIGKVVDLKLSDQFDSIELTARLDKNTDPLLKEDSNFWVVKPRVGKEGISGLSTILSGGHIEISPGQSKVSRYDFVGLETPPITPAGTPGLRITLNSDDEFAFTTGDPIIYKGLTIGRFEKVKFNFEERVVYYDAFINEPYHQLITKNTRFWNTSGLRLDLNSDGISVQTGNVETLLTNGITFGVPQGMEPGPQATQEDVFRIFTNVEQASATKYLHTVEYIMLVSSSIRGLEIGAPVEYRGVHVGKVLDTNFNKNKHEALLEDDLKIPVLLSLEPGLVGLPDTELSAEGIKLQTRKWIKKGLKASLATGNLLTGSLFVELQHFPEHPMTSVSSKDGYEIIPTIEDNLGQIANKAGDFIDTLNKLPLESLTKDTQQVLKDLSKTLNDLNQTSYKVNALVDQTHKAQLPQQLQDTLEKVSTMTQGLSEGSPGYDELLNTLQAVQSSLHELKPLLNKVKNRPNSLIFSDNQPSDIEPFKAPNTGQ
ncbi:paraquat-inducible protein B [Marinomonas sp. SBI22]|uniref:intermembrane transport protein PqiB n=1 Tax=unclassified Marinomonas TaxID=196814 RepID=UPI0007AF3CDC|nr:MULTISPECIES: intermembrane transport protein PqiB [unclassified Marinomonas]KZM42036.1 paraquat-inducible protein B [Marinomonas sp. SBI22]KZM47121.1 paraquat-inducible protein B [Marinomonas sp. SBI8L]